MPTIKEVKMKLRHREWAEQIAECQNSGMSVREWCQSKGLSYNTYYRRLRAVRLDLLKQAEGDGFLLFYKRLESGRFNWPRNEQEVRNLTREQFVWLMQGLSIDQPKAIKKIEGGIDIC